MELESCIYIYIYLISSMVMHSSVVLERGRTAGQAGRGRGDADMLICFLLLHFLFAFDKKSDS